MPRSANATEMFIAMESAVSMYKHTRTTTDPESPQTSSTLEAKPCSVFELSSPVHNVQVCVPMDRKWAIANAIHFFSASEKADALFQYNRHASKFLSNEAGEYFWRGAYGAIAMPQIQECIPRLRQHPDTRRAVISMGGASPQDINRPACWSFLQFLNSLDGLNLLVYQRSLNLTRVMQYDLIVLTNILSYVAKSVAMPVGSLYWTIGSLHTVGEYTINRAGQRNASLLLPFEVMESPLLCADILQRPEKYPTLELA